MFFQSRHVFFLSIWDLTTESVSLQFRLGCSAFYLIARIYMACLKTSSLSPYNHFSFFVLWLYDKSVDGYLLELLDGYLNIYVMVCFQLLYFGKIWTSTGILLSIAPHNDTWTLFLRLTADLVCMFVLYDRGMTNMVVDIRGRICVICVNFSRHQRFPIPKMKVLPDIRLYCLLTYLYLRIFYICYF